MTIEEAIEKEKSIAKSNHELANSYHTDFNVYMRQGGACRERAEYHEQVAEWLEELQRLKEQQPILDNVRAEIAEYGSIWVAYVITGHSDRDIENLIEGVLKRAKEQVLEIIDKYRQEGKI